MEYKEFFLKDICFFQEGYVNPKQTISDYFDGEIKWLRANDLQNGYVYNTSRTLTKLGFESAGKSAKLFKPNTIAISKSGTIGRLGILKDYMCGNRAVINIECNNEKIDIKYLYYFLLFNRSYIESLAQGSVQKNLYIFILEEVKIKLPDIATQKKIVKALNDIDKKIELNNQMNENLLGLGDIIYRETFVKEGLQKGWEICKLKDVAYNFDSKRRPISSREREKRKGIYPYYGATSVIDYVDDYIFDGIYLLMGEDGTVVTSEGKPVLQYIWGKNWINNHAHVLSGNTISTEHLMFALRNCNVRDIITGAVQPKINQENMNDIKIVLADPKTNIEFEKIIDMLMKQYKNNIEQNQRLEKIRDMLLPKLMNGKIDLDKIEI